MPIDRKHIQAVAAECNRLMALIEEWDNAQRVEVTRDGFESQMPTPRESGLVRHQSMLLTRALAKLRAWR